VPIGVVLLGGVRTAAAKLQAEAVKQHVDRGGRLGSKWTAFGVGMGFLAVIVLAIFGVVYARIPHSKVTIGKDEVFYTGNATQTDAKQLGDALKKIGYLQDRGVSVFVDKGSQGTTISMVVKDGAWNQPDTLPELEEVVREVAGSVGGFPVYVQVMDSEQHVKDHGLVGRVAVGKDEVYYYDDATAEQAAGVGRGLQHEGYFTGQGVTVLLQKRSGDALISYVVSDGFWNDPQHMEQFKKITGAVAGYVGGLPVKMRLVNSSLDTEKEVEVR
jgi:hypothetical protein